MPKDANPGFEVVTVRPTSSEERDQGFQIRGRHIRLVRETVQSMIMFAYGVHATQIVDAPEWVASKSFSADGIPNVEGDPNLPQFQSLIRQLLADHFGLKTHSAKRKMSCYALRVASGGVKILKSSSPESAGPDQTGSGGLNGQTMNFTNNSMDEFALGMQSFIDRPVVNQTALAGRYDFTLKWMPDQLSQPQEDAPPGLFTAMREQLGLELKATRDAVQVVAVDAVEGPSPN